MVKNVAANIGATPTQLALAWTMHNPAVTAPIMGGAHPRSPRGQPRGAQYDKATRWIARRSADLTFRCAVLSKW